MKVLLLDDAAAVAEAGAGLVAAQLEVKPASVLGLATGSTPIALYARLVKRRGRGEVSFAQATTFNLDEYIGMAADDSRSYRHYMRQHLFDAIDIDPRNTHLPACADGDDPVEVGARYEQAIKDAGGIDLQVLGIGRNGHIGFNEPTSSLGSRTRVKTLTQDTIKTNARLFPDAAGQPQLAMTMGIATILDARQVVLLATGAAKAEALAAMIEGPITAACPASALQWHPAVTVLADAEAASRLALRDYYRWVCSQEIRLAGH